MPANVLQKILGHTDIKTTLDTYCDVFNAFEKKHRDNTFEYLKNNNLLIFNTNNNVTVPKEKVTALIELIVKMQEENNPQLLNILNALPLVA